jgi:hypothetical protein
MPSLAAISHEVTMNLPPAPSFVSANDLPIYSETFLSVTGDFFKRIPGTGTYLEFISYSNILWRGSDAHPKNSLKSF